VSSYLKDTSSFYEKCRQRALDVGEPPAKYLDELSRKGEHLEKLSKHIKEEKGKLKRSFEELQKTLMQIIDEKEKECFQLLNKEILDLAEEYKYYEKLMMAGAKPADTQNIFPGADILEQKMSQIENMSQLRAFMVGIQEDIQTQNLYSKEEDSAFSRMTKKLDDLIHGFRIPESSFPKIQSQILNSENLTKDLMKGFSQQDAKIKNSIESRIKASVYESKIIVDDQFEILRDWLPKSYKFDLKLLFRSSVDGMSCERFHEKCDGKRATINLIKC